MAALTPVTSGLSEFNLGTQGILPIEIGLHILQFLPIPALASLALVDKSLTVLSNDESLWKFFCERDFPTQSTSTLHPKDHYRICYNLKNGRYTTAHRAFDRLERPLLIGGALFKHVSEEPKFLSLQNPDGSFFNIAFPKGVISLFRWNGSQLGYHINAEADWLIFSNIDAECKPQEILRIKNGFYFIWQDHQMVTITYNDSHSTLIVTIWDQNSDGTWKMSSEMPDHQRYLKDCDDFAWNGKYLAATSRIDDSILPCAILKKSPEKKLELCTNLDCLGSLLRWNGDLLVTDDCKENTGTVKVWDSCQNFKLVQTLACPECGTDYRKISDLMLRGNQLFVSVESNCLAEQSARHFVTLWEQDKDGLYQKIQHIWRVCTIIPQKLGFSQEALLVLKQSWDHSIKSLKFTSSYRKIFKELVREFSEFTSDSELTRTRPDIIKKNYELAKERLLRMPKSQKKLFFEELNTVKGITNAEEVFSDTSIFPELLAADIVLAIQNSLKVTVATPLTH